jgi:hypothetical protein
MFSDARRQPLGLPMRQPRLSEKAAQGMLLTVRCNLCRRRAHFWAADLVTVLGANASATKAPFPCGHCGTAEFLDLRWRVPSPSELAGLTVRRPVKQVVRWTWRDERA